MPAGSAATCGMLSPALNPLVLSNVQNSKKERQNMQTAAKQRKTPRHRGPVPPATEATRGPTPPPSPRRWPLLPRVPRPRSAGLSASGHPCAVALTRVTSGPAQRTDRRIGGGAPRGPTPVPPSTAACLASSRARIFWDHAELAGCKGSGTGYPRPASWAKNLMFFGVVRRVGNLFQSFSTWE